MDWNVFLTNLKGGISSTSQALTSIGELLDDAKGKVDRMISNLRTGTMEQRLEKLSQIVERDPAVLASFLSSPVDVSCEKLYSIDNYGSAMAPFYTVLSLWVGALILVAILKTEVKSKRGVKYTAYQTYFGRSFIFLGCCIIQALVVTLGDLAILKIQCANPVLFVLAGVFTSIVFTFFVYTLTSSFGNVGKAVAVIFLVLQVAGAGGTYPIEVTPKFFQILHPFMPFTYAIDAMRETIGGLYGFDYLISLVKVFLYIPVSLFIGLFLRKRLVPFNKKIHDRLKGTEIM